jgi:hypothetical protein
MSNFAFDVNFVPLGGVARVERMSSLWPIVGRRSYSLEHAVIDLDNVLHLWRQRLSALFAKGRDVVKDELHLQLMSNCHPAGLGVSVADASQRFTPWRCNMECFCPWCWARRSGEVYNLISERLPSRMKKSAPTHTLYLLSERIAVRAGGWGDKRLHEFLAYGAIKLSESLRRSRAGMGLRLSTLEPQYGRNNIKRWVFRHRLLLIYGAGSKIPASVVKHRKGIVFDALTRKDLQIAVARCFRYPTGLLTGPLAALPKVMAAREGLRLCEHSGALRKPPKS